jgi:hypothetical protein
MQVGLTVRRQSLPAHDGSMIADQTGLARVKFLYAS